MANQKHIATVALLVAFLGSASAECPSVCVCRDLGKRAECQDLGLKAAPPGYWPDVTVLLLQDNQIRTLNKNSFKGYPKVTSIALGNNPMKKLDLSSFVGLEYLQTISTHGSSIETVVPLSGNAELPRLVALNLQDSKVSSLPSNALNGLPKLTGLVLSGNPLQIPGNRPLVTSPTLLHLTLNNVDASGISGESFKGLPSVEELFIENSKIVDIRNAFSTLPSLEILSLENNPLQTIRAGSFSQSQKISRLLLAESDIQSIETDALDGALNDFGFISIYDTPMACDCGYESLYRWANSKYVSISYTCPSKVTHCDITP